MGGKKIMKYKLLYTGNNEVIAECIHLDDMKRFRQCMITEYDKYIDNVGDKLLILKDNNADDKTLEVVQ
jgi:hypothetical protein